VSEVRIFKGALEDDEIIGDVVLRGVIDQNTFKFIGMAWYQREQGFSKKHCDQIISAYFQNKRIEDITIGMRGHRCDSDKNGTYLLRDKCFCVNGGQRLYAAALAMKERPDLKINLGAKIIFGTTEESENELFCSLGTTSVRIAPSVLLRNRKKKSKAAHELVELNKNPDFALKDRVAWDQVKTLHELITGYTFTRIVGSLHRHKTAGLGGAKLYELLAAMDDLIDIIGHEALRDNVIRFFDIIDKCWPIRNLAGGKEPRPHLKPLFLITIARVMSAYPDFWDGKDRNDFYFPNKFIPRLRNFKLSQYIQASNVISSDILFEVIRKQLRLDPFEEEEAA
jgi:hypothetical protein